ncbi:DUF1120 domain-containing protein [Pantoea dispersa]|uniref:DUF1120 domain-containing protein n=1 Tax=Pantoea dispersa TaxID=59814 RepID=UPI001238A1E7|nr:DUF1120 domain-containing protein [Pantoea dispersa]KAA8671728.1 DUF1120 domain-containing protein [Pantoea dispersa]
MMKKMMKTTCALAVLAASCNVMAESVDMRVTGAVTPIACKPTLSDNGVVDFGEINTNALKKDELNLLQSKKITLSIDCTAPAKIAVLATNARPGTTLAISEEGPAGTAKPLIGNGYGLNGGVAGLGLDGDKKIGAYGLHISNHKIDGQAASILRSTDKNTWVNNYYDSLFDDNGHYKYITWHRPDEPAPTAFKNASTTITVNGYINKSSELDLTKPIKLDGQANFEMFYL